MFGFNNARAIEQEMAEWLAHPMEFGVPPKSVRLKRTYRGKVITQGGVKIHLVEYEMPDGTTGRGFVNGSLTWSFIGSEVNAIDDDQLMVAYCGWAWLFPATQAGNVLTEFQSLSEEKAFTEKKRADGFDEIQVTSRYKIETSELFEFEGTSGGKKFVGAGNTETEVVIEATDVRAVLPQIYFLLGREAILSMK